MTTDTHYSLLRFVPDPARGEALNVGVVLWTPDEIEVRLDDEALEGLARINPRLDRSGLAGIKLAIAEWMKSAEGSPEKQVEQLKQNPPFLQLLVTDPRFTRLDLGDDAGIEPTVERLVERLVRPKKRAVVSGFHPERALETRLRPLLRSKVVERHHPFSLSRSGIAREVDFFVNSGANLAMDTVQLAIRKSDEIMRRADAEAFKVEDIVAKNDVAFSVFCHFSDAADYATVNKQATKVIESAGASVFDDVEDAAARISGAASTD
jgi:hypothetical protein